MTTSNTSEATRTLYDSKDHGCGCSHSSDALQQSKDITSDLAQNFQDSAVEVGQQVQAAAKNLSDKARASAANLSENADRAITDVGHRFREAAENLRRSAPRESTIGSAAVALADNLDAGGQYLESHGVEDMVGDLSSLIRRHPMQALFITLTTGFLVGTAFKRR